MAKEAKPIYQIKITLDDTKPTIWRRVLVPADIRLNKLHGVIQTAMGWWNCHLHHFYLPAQRGFIPAFFGPTHGDFAVDDAQDECKVALSDLLNTPKKKLKYEYDFGDSWEHTLLLDKILVAEAGMKYPHCTAGARLPARRLRRRVGLCRVAGHHGRSRT